MYMTNNATSSARSLSGDHGPADAEHGTTHSHRAGANADQHSADRFRRMLDQEPEILAPPEPWPPRFIYTPADSQPDAGATSSNPNSANALPDMPRSTVHPAPLDSQMLNLRATTGPLAGLLLQANWQGARLNLRLSSPSIELNARLRRESQNLSSALSAALGLEVNVEVQRAMGDANEDHQ